MFAEPHDLTRLPDLFSIGIGVGMVAGGIAGGCWPSDSDAEFINNMVKGASLGSFAGALIVVPVWVVATAAGA